MGARKLRKIRVLSIEEERAGYQLLQGVVIESPHGATCWNEGEKLKAYALTQIVAPGRIGDELLVEISPLWHGIGTGGSASVVANLSYLPSDDQQAETDAGHRLYADDKNSINNSWKGHLVKSRYTPIQVCVRGADEQGSPWHEKLKNAQDLQKMPVVVADIHSSISAVVSGIRAFESENFKSNSKNGQSEDSREALRQIKIAYIMTDGGALPAQISNQIAWIRENNYLNGTISAGQAFGGDFEAVNIYSALLVAKYCVEADIAIVSQGPGNLGTDTYWGFSGTGVAEALSAVTLLKGIPVAVLRMSGADLRERHRGISHHSTTVLERITTSPALVPYVDLEKLMDLRLVDSKVIEKSRKQLISIAQKGHHLHKVDTSLLWNQLCKDREAGFKFSTMGRGLDQDPISFLASAAAGWVGASQI